MWRKKIAELLSIDEQLLGGASMTPEDLLRFESAEIKWLPRSISKHYLTSTLEEGN